MSDNVRFKVVAGGRRSGKTERAKRYIAKTAMATQGMYFVAAPTRDQVKRIYWDDLKKMCFSISMRTRPAESELIVRLANGSTISLIGLDQPSRIEGIPWSGGIVDEIADVKASAWPSNIAPALDTVNPLRPDYRAWCWLIGVPDGLNHYYDLAQYAQHSGNPDWKFYTWKSADILSPDVISAAKARMSARQYRQEYEASFETVSGRIYDEYGPDNYTDSEILPHERLMWFHDFNFTPMSSGVGVVRDGIFFVLDEIVLRSAISRQSAMEFVEKYKDHANKSVIVYGDPAGRAGEKHGHISNYTEMEQVLRIAGWQLERRVTAQAPAIRDRQNALRARIRAADGRVRLLVNPKKAVYAHKGLATVQIKEGSTFLEEVTDYQHITTAIGYCVAYEWPIRPPEVAILPPNPTKNFYGRQI